MGLKQFLKQKKILESGVLNNELTLPGEPMIYSIKYSICKRKFSVQYFRNKQWNSIIKCLFPAYYNTKTPVVLFVRFYISPPEDAKLKPADLKKEIIPAVKSYEICDYLISFLEILHHVLVNSYRQFVKIDAEKYYSTNPRTVFKFMKWEHYVNYKARDSTHPAT